MEHFFASYACFFVFINDFGFNLRLLKSDLLAALGLLPTGEYQLYYQLAILWFLFHHSNGQQNSLTVEFSGEKIEGNLRWANMELSMHFRRANTEPSMHFRQGKTKPSMHFWRANTETYLKAHGLAPSFCPFFFDVIKKIYKYI